jgi:hypothetical protein
MSHTKVKPPPNHKFKGIDRCGLDQQRLDAAGAPSAIAWQNAARSPEKWK